MKKILTLFVASSLSFSYGSISLAGGVELPNPASKLCVDMGGTLKSYEKGEEGTISLCAFQDDVYLNGLIEEWTLFRYKLDSAAPSLAIKAFFDHVPYIAPQGPVGHPALQYCEQLGGNRVIITESSGGESGVCEFADGSEIEEWTLFRGPEIHLGLSKALQAR